jgi:hypothetical protein
MSGSGWMQSAGIQQEYSMNVAIHWCLKVPRILLKR